MKPIRRIPTRSSRRVQSTLEYNCECYTNYFFSLDRRPSFSFLSRRPSAFDRPLFYLGIYGTLSILTVLIQVIQLAVSYVAAYRAAIALHDRLLLRVIKAPREFFPLNFRLELNLTSSSSFFTARWFDTTPAGRILNRFSADLGALDGSLSSALVSLSLDFIVFQAQKLNLLSSFLIGTVEDRSRLGRGSYRCRSGRLHR